MHHPYADLLEFSESHDEPGQSRGHIEIRNALLNPHGVVHGGVLYSLADTCMGGALYSLLADGQSCATIDCSITYFRPVADGVVTCTARVVNKGRSIAALEADLVAGGKTVAKAYGNFSIFSRPPAS